MPNRLGRVYCRNKYNMGVRMNRTSFPLLAGLRVQHFVVVIPAAKEDEERLPLPLGLPL